MLAKKLSMSLIIVVVILFVGQSALADMTYTFDADFDLGILDEVNHDSPNNNQLQLNSTGTPFAFVNVAASAQGTIVRINADTGDIMGEYLTAPEGRGRNPSRTGVDSKGNVWTANRDEAQPTAVGGEDAGSVVKIGIVIGGTRVDADGTPNDSGQYLAPPFDYNTCVDRGEKDGLIMTSRGLGNVLPWPGSGDQTGGEDGIVEGAQDECILLYQRLPGAPNAHHVSVDADDNVWVGGYPEGPAMFYKLDGQTAAVMDSFDAAEIGCGGFGGLVDASGVIWSADFDFDSVFSESPDRSALLYYDPVSRKGGCIDVGHSYGLAADSEGFIWNSMWRESQIVKIDPNDLEPEIVDGFPKAIEPGERSSEGVAVTPTDNHVWVARGFGQEVSRLDKNGDFVSVINLLDNPSSSRAQDPTGVAVDANGKVWVTNLGSDNVMRIDPTGGDPNGEVGGLGAVDMVVDLGLGAGPDNYSNMTGVVNLVSTPDQGTWTVIHDGVTVGTEWDTIVWNTENQGSVPEGTAITVEARASDNEPVDGELEGGYEPVSDGELLSLTGQYIQIRAILEPNDEGDSPVLSDLTVTSVQQPKGQVCDLNEDEIIDIYDILGIYFTIGDDAREPFDPRDWDTDKTITFEDVKGCLRQCTYKYCQSKNVCSK